MYTSNKKKIFSLLILAGSFSWGDGKASSDSDLIPGTSEYPTPSEMKSIEAIQNPERGYHLESNFFVHNLENPWHEITYPSGWIDQGNKRFQTSNDKLSEIQLYLYLTDYVGKDLGSGAIEKMQGIFDSARRHGYKLILRFAYDYSPGATDVTFEDIFNHLNQLEPFIKRNIGLIDIWQIGFIGAWGEGHSTSLREDWQNKTKMVKRMLEIFADRYLMLRYPDDLESFNLTEKEKKRIGYNNDYFTASEHPRAPKNDYTFNSDAYDQVKNASPHVKVVGEIPYAEDSEWGLHSTFSVPNALRVLRDHHYSAFDITQNNALNIENWKNFRVSANMLAKQNILFEAEYFLDSGGEYVYRSAYEFIRDHLGYRLYFDQEKTEILISDENLKYDIYFRNVGFSAILNPRPVYLIIIDKYDKVVNSLRLETDPKEWQPFDPSANDYKALMHRIKGVASIPLPPGNYKVGLWLPDPTELLRNQKKYAIQFANKNLEVWEKEGYRVNIVSEINL